MTLSGLVSADAAKFTGSNSGQILTLPSPIEGTLRLIRNASTVPVTIDASLYSGTVEGAPTMVLYPGESVMLISFNSDWTVF
jgi:hypothetical protein